MPKFPLRASALIALVASTLSMSVAHAADEGTVVSGASERRTAYVSYSDLNLSSDKGLDRLRARVRSAARSVCSVGDGVSLGERIDANSCRAAAVKDAEGQIAEALAARAAGMFAAGGVISIAAD